MDGVLPWTRRNEMCEFPRAAPRPSPEAQPEEEDASEPEGEEEGGEDEGEGEEVEEEAGKVDDPLSPDAIASRLLSISVRDRPAEPWFGSALVD